MDFDSLLTEALDKVTRKYEITGSEKQLDELESLLAWAQYLGSIGHSGTAEFSVDGDGSARIEVKKGNSKIKLDDNDEHWVNKDGHIRHCGTEFKVGLN
jgi:hypothetical protein